MPNVERLLLPLSILVLQSAPLSFLLPDLLRNVGMTPGDILLAEGRQGVADVSYLLEKWGVRERRSAGDVP